MSDLMMREPNEREVQLQRRYSALYECDHIIFHIDRAENGGFVLHAGGLSGKQFIAESDDALAAILQKQLAEWLCRPRPDDSYEAIQSERRGVAS